MPLLGLLLAIGNVGLAKKQIELEGSSSSQGGTYKVRRIQTYEIILLCCGLSVSVELFLAKGGEGLFTSLNVQGAFKDGKTDAAIEDTAKKKQPNKKIQVAPAAGS